MAEASAQELSFAAFLSDRISDQRHELIARWVAALKEDPAVDVADVLPEEDLLNDFPAVLERIATFVATPDAEPLEALVVQDVGRVAELHRCQGLGLQELLREYHILSELIQGFAEQAAGEYPDPSEPREVARVVGQLIGAINVLGAITARSYQRWQGRYDREWRGLLESYEQILSHELGNRLGAADTALRLLSTQMPDEPDRRTHLYGLIQESIQSGRQTIDDVASLARPYLTGSQSGLSLWLVVKESVRLADAEADRGGISVSVTGEVPDVEVPGAPVRIALANLLSNAVKYHRNGGPERWVRVSARSDDGSKTVEITVQDNGPGIPESAREMMFDYRFRGDVRGEGSGLGVAITREVLQEVGGSISLREGPEGGATFTLTVPAFEDDG